MFKKLEKIVEYFGIEHQVRIKLPEECEEVIEECTADKIDEDKLVDEMADKLVVTLGILHHNHWFKRVFERMIIKLERTVKRIDSGYYESEKHQVGTKKSTSINDLGLTCNCKCTLAQKDIYEVLRCCGCGLRKVLT